MTKISCKTCPFCELPKDPDEEEWICHFSDPIGSTIDPTAWKEPWCSNHPIAPGQRDKLAAMAMQGMVGDPHAVEPSEPYAETIARRAYQIADAMLRMRDK